MLRVGWSNKEIATKAYLGGGIWEMSVELVRKSSRMAMDKDSKISLLGSETMRGMTRGGGSESG